MLQDQGWGWGHLEVSREPGWGWVSRLVFWSLGETGGVGGLLWTEKNRDAQVSRTFSLDPHRNQ
jgi:hypothetical protein